MQQISRLLTDNTPVKAFFLARIVCLCLRMAIHCTTAPGTGIVSCCPADSRDCHRHSHHAGLSSGGLGSAPASLYCARGPRLCHGNVGCRNAVMIANPDAAAANRSVNPHGKAELYKQAHKPSMNAGARPKMTAGLPADPATRSAQRNSCWMREDIGCVHCCGQSMRCLRLKSHRLPQPFGPSFSAVSALWWPGSPPPRTCR